VSVEPEEQEFEIETPSTGPEARKATIPEKQEDARRTLAIALVVIFGIEVIGAMLALWFCKPPMIDSIKEVLTLILGPTVALVGSATGFYFGTRMDTQPPPANT
jgi:hypothetical protein